MVSDGKYSIFGIISASYYFIIILVICLQFSKMNPMGLQPVESNMEIKVRRQKNQLMVKLIVRHFQEMPLGCIRMFQMSCDTGSL